MSTTPAAAVEPIQEEERRKPQRAFPRPQKKASIRKIQIQTANYTKIDDIVMNSPDGMSSLHNTQCSQYAETPFKPLHAQSFGLNGLNHGELSRNETIASFKNKDSSTYLQKTRKLSTQKSSLPARERSAEAREGVLSGQDSVDPSL